VPEGNGIGRNSPEGRRNASPAALCNRLNAASPDNCQSPPGRFAEASPLREALLNVEARHLLQHVERAARGILCEIERGVDQPLLGGGVRDRIGWRRRRHPLLRVRGHGNRGERQRRAAVTERDARNP